MLCPLLELDTDGVRVLIELPIRDVRPEFIRLLELVLSPLLELDTDGVPVVIELPIRELRAELIRLLEFVLPTRPAALMPDPPWLELGNEGLAALGELEDGGRMLDEAGARKVVDRLEFMLPRLRVAPNVFDLDDMDVLGLTVLLEMLRPERLELPGVRTDRELMLLGLRLVRLELAGARLTLEGALARGAGAGAGLEACRLDELLLPELELLRSVFALNTGLQSRIKTEMSTRIPFLTSCRYSIANMICLLSANGSKQGFYSNY